MYYVCFLPFIFQKIWIVADSVDKKVKLVSLFQYFRACMGTAETLSIFWTCDFYSEIYKNYSKNIIKISRDGRLYKHPPTYKVNLVQDSALFCGLSQIFNAFTKVTAYVYVVWKLTERQTFSELKILKLNFWLYKTVLLYLYFSFS